MATRDRVGHATAATFFGYAVRRVTTAVAFGFVGQLVGRKQRYVPGGDMREGVRVAVGRLRASVSVVMERSGMEWNGMEWSGRRTSALN